MPFGAHTTPKLLPLVNRYGSTGRYVILCVETYLVDKTVNKNTLASRRTKQNILDSSVAILGLEGYSALTTSKLSGHAKISKGALYHHFSNLDEVKYATLEYLVESFNTITDPQKFAELSGYLAVTENLLFSNMKEQPIMMKALYAFIAEAMFDDKKKYQLQKLFRNSMDTYFKAVKHFYPDLSSEQLTSIVQVIDAYFTGAVIHWYLLDDPKQCRANWNMFSSMLLGMLPGRKIV